MPFGTLKGPFGTPKVPNGTLGCQSCFHVQVRFRLLLGFLEPSLAFRRVFNSYSKIFISSLDNSGIFNNNYLVDKYSKINFDKVQIIHNFIVIQLSPLFPCKQSYFNTNHQPITKLFNQSELIYINHVWSTLPKHNACWPGKCDAISSNPTIQFGNRAYRCDH